MIFKIYLVLIFFSFPFILSVSAQEDPANSDENIRESTEMPESSPVNTTNPELVEENPRTLSDSDIEFAMVLRQFCPSLPSTLGLNDILECNAHVVARLRNQCGGGFCIPLVDLNLLTQQEQIVLHAFLKSSCYESLFNLLVTPEAERGPHANTITSALNSAIEKLPFYSGAVTWYEGNLETAVTTEAARNENGQDTARPTRRFSRYRNNGIYRFALPTLGFAAGSIFTGTGTTLAHTVSVQVANARSVMGLCYEGPEILIPANSCLRVTQIQQNPVPDYSNFDTVFMEQLESRRCAGRPAIREEPEGTHRGVH